MTSEGPITPVPVVHAKGDAARLDELIDLLRLVARPGALSVGLDEIPRRLARLFPCDVCSIYLLEGDELVMRGNVGFPADALGDVRLAIGQGITGMAVEMMRPISLDAAERHTPRSASSRRRSCSPRRARRSRARCSRSSASPRLATSRGCFAGRLTVTW